MRMCEDIDEILTFFVIVRGEDSLPAFNLATASKDPAD